MGRVWFDPFRNGDCGSNAQAVKDWMIKKDKQIDGVKMTNSHWVILKYFGPRIFNQVLTDPENFYLVLEPTVTAQIAIGKQDMSDGSIFAATT